MAYAFNVRTPLKIYLKACVGILDRAQSEFQKGNLAGAYLFYYRYVDLCTNKLAAHPEICTAPGASPRSGAYSLARQEYLQLVHLEVPAVLAIVEDLQQRLDNSCHKHQLSLARNIAKSKTTATAVPGTAVAEGPTALPPTFNENRFNQSLTFFQETSTAVGNTSSGGPSPLEPLYPELPKLSFPTYI